MYEISETTYRETACRLLTAIGGSEYFNGCVEVECEVFRGALRCTLLVYREEVADHDATWSRITDIIPVWWEFESVGEYGSSLNDFSWSALREYLI